MAVEFDPNFSFNQQLWYYYTSNRGKIRSRYNGLTRKECIIADSAEPKSIAEIRAAGMWIVPSIKGTDSIIVGLDILRRYRIHFTI